MYFCFTGQDAFYENYFTAQRDHIFLNVELLIYVFDVEREGGEINQVKEQ
jgi:hypothetical protein